MSLTTLHALSSVGQAIGSLTEKTTNPGSPMLPSMQATLRCPVLDRIGSWSN